MQAEGGEEGEPLAAPTQSHGGWSPNSLAGWLLVALGVVQSVTGIASQILSAG